MFRFSLLQILYILPGILLGLSVHEFFHALIATRLGDPTPKNQGRLSLNPLKHLDPIGFLFIILVGFGWAKPVNINHSYLKNPRRDDTLIAISGPFSNILVGILFLIIMRYSLSAGIEHMVNIAYYSAYINFVLAVFNVLPIYPLDGFHVLSNAIGLKNFRLIAAIQKYSMFILLGLVITRITTYLVGIPANYLLNFFIRYII
jgi:Zn-dependent protease